MGFYSLFVSDCSDEKGEGDMDNIWPSTREHERVVGFDADCLGSIMHWFPFPHLPFTFSNSFSLPFLPSHPQPKYSYDDRPLFPLSI